MRANNSSHNSQSRHSQPVLDESEIAACDEGKNAANFDPYSTDAARWAQ